MDRVDRPSSRPPDGGRWRVRQWWPAAVSLALYIFLTFLEFGLSTSLGSGRVAVEDGSDGVNQIWFLEWTQYAIAHGHNPFFSQWQSFPTGLNVLSDTSMIALGTVFSPITTLFGPVVTWNVLVRLAVIVSAFSMCLVLRRWTRWWPAAFVGGAVYGYSAYITFNLGHLFLVFVPLPPLMFLLLHETLVRHQWRPVVTGGLLGAACAVQYLVSSEILTTTVLMGAGATVLYLYLLAFRSTLRTKLAYMGNCLIYAIVVGGVLLSVPVLFTLFGREHLDGVPQSPATLSALHGDLFSPLAPGSHEWHSSVLFSSVFDHVASTGETLYLGLPLIAMVVATVVLLRRRRIVPFAAVMALVAYILSLGQRLYVDGHYTRIPLPFEVLAHAPYLKSLLAVRFSLFTVMFCAGIVAVGLDALYWHAQHWDWSSWLAARWRGAAALSLPLVLGVVVAIPFVPISAQAAPPTHLSPYFTTNAVKSIPDGSVVLAYPFPKAPQIGRSYTDLVDEILLDQAVSGMRFKVIGGYGWWPVPQQSYATPNAPPLQPVQVETFLDAEFYGSATPPPNLRGLLRQFMKQNHVDTVIVLPLGKNPATVELEMVAAIGRPVLSGGVAVWSHVQRLLAASPS